MKRKQSTVRHNVSRAELGECFCPKCAPELHVQAEAESVPTVAPTNLTTEVATQTLPPVQRIEPIAVGGKSGTKTALEEEYERLTVALREEEARWSKARAALDGAITECRAREAAIVSRQRDLRECASGLYAARKNAAEEPRPWMERGRWQALTEAQLRAVRLVSRMSLAGPDYAAAIAAERVELMAALAKLDEEAA